MIEQAWNYKSVVAKDSNNTGGSGNGSGEDVCTSMLTLSMIVSQEGSSTSFGTTQININSLKVIDNYEMPAEAVIKKIDYDSINADNVYLLTIGDVSKQELDKIECTNISISHNNIFIEGEGLVKGDTYVSAKEKAGTWGGETQVWTTKDFDYFVWYTYDASTDISMRNVLFILDDPTDVPVIPV